jgi:hypothetical protein
VRKSTVTALVLLGGLLFVMMWVADAGMTQHRAEIEVGSQMTRQFEGDLVPSTRVRLRRERGSEDGIVADREQHLLLVTASPSAARWDRDPDGKAFARALAERAHGDVRYGPERPVPYVEVVLSKPDGTRVRLGFREDVSGRLQAFSVPPLKK